MSVSQLKRNQAWFDRRRTSSEVSTDCDDSGCDDSDRDEPGRTEETHIYDSRTGALLKVFEGFGEGVAFSPDGRSLALVSWGSLSIIDVNTCAPSLKCKSSTLRLRNVFYSADGKQVACVDSSGVLVFDATTAQLCFMATDSALFEAVEPWDENTPVVDSPNQVEPDERAGRLLEFWNRSLPGFRPATAADSGMDIQGIAFCPTGQLAAVHQREDFSDNTMRSVPGGVTLLDTTTGQTGLFLESPQQKWLRTVSFSPDGKHVAATGDHQVIFVWSVETGLSNVSHWSTTPCDNQRFMFAINVYSSGRNVGRQGDARPSEPAVRTVRHTCV